MCSLVTGPPAQKEWDLHRVRRVPLSTKYTAQYFYGELSATSTRNSMPIIEPPRRWYEPENVVTFSISSKGHLPQKRYRQTAIGMMMSYFIFLAFNLFHGFKCLIILFCASSSHW